MSIIVIIGLIWGFSALCRAGRQAAQQARIERAARARALENARRAARQAQLMEDWRRQQLAAKAEAARLISAERARMQAEREEARRAEQEAKEQEKARREAQKAAKREYECQQAEADLEYLDGLRAGYMDLLDALEEELNASTTSDKRRLTLRRQMLNTEEKLHRLDTKMAKAYFTANLAKEAC